MNAQAVARLLHKHSLRMPIVTALLAILLATCACGGGSSAATPVDPGTGGGSGGSAQTPIQVKMGDAPADRVVSFEVTVGPISLTPSSGAAVTVLSGTRRLEMAHLSGTNEPLALLSVPQGDYSGASITVANPEVSFINTSGVLTKLEPAFTQAITINFSPALHVGASAAVMHIDLNVANALSFDALGNVTGVALSASSFSVSSAAVAAEDNQHPEDGELEDLTGTVSSVTGSSFTLVTGQNGASLTFVTDAATEFNDGATLGTMLNTIVKVEGRTRTDGSLYAKEVEGIENNTGAEVEGLITQVTGNPASQLVVNADSGVGSGIDDTKIGSSMTIDVSSANYKVSKGSVDDSGLPQLGSSPEFPFDGATVHGGQRVEVESENSMADDNPHSVSKVKLKQQSLSGTVSGLAGATSAGPVTFTLTLPADSAVAILSGQTSVTVFWQPGTDLRGAASVNNGDTVRVRGLLFFTGSNFNLIARRISE